MLPYVIVSRREGDLVQIVMGASPGEEELQKQRALVATLWADLAWRETELATLHADLAQFDRLYRYRLGHRYAQLDELRARIAEARAQRMPERPAVRETAERARERATQSASQVPDETQPVPEARFVPSDSLKSLFHTVVRAVHPDHASSESDAQRRHELMVAANEAYAAGDEGRLREILECGETQTIETSLEVSAVELASALRAVEDARRSIAAIEHEIAILRRSDLHSFMLRFQQAADQGRDLIVEMMDELDVEIESARTQLEEIGPR